MIAERDYHSVSAFGSSTGTFTGISILSLNSRSSWRGGGVEVQFWRGPVEPRHVTSWSRRGGSNHETKV